ncbi:MAG: hypothetical protein JST27_03115 [Bacteroidetes bacterium]|nr:hypothetical protein [Bacteroidota bacterium]
MQLSETWFVEGTVDFEMQKYRLLAYLRDVDALFGKQELYPQLSDVIFHHENLIAFRNNKQFLQDAFPRRMSELNLQQAELIYERMLEDDELMQELEDITAYALMRIRKTIGMGTELYDEVAHTMEVYPVGLLPVYKDQGYLLLRWGSHQETRAYSYSVSLFERGDAQYRGLKMSYLNSWTRSLMHTPQHIKTELTRQAHSMENPAFFALETALEWPLQATILPIARRVFIRYLSAQA